MKQTFLATCVELLCGSFLGLVRFRRNLVPESWRQCAPSGSSVSVHMVAGELYSVHSPLQQDVHPVTAQTDPAALALSPTHRNGSRGAQNIRLMKIPKASDSGLD